MSLHLILLGPPASGKGTQGRRLAEREGLAYLSTGALLREVLSTAGPIADEVRPILARGGYVSDSLMCDILGSWLQSHESKGWILDGFPRTLAQDDFLRDWLAARGEFIDGVVGLEVPEEDLILRIQDRVECPSCRWTGQTGQLGDGNQCPKCGAKSARREDDSLENFRKRYEEFTKHAVPVIERYRGLGSLASVDATRPIEMVGTQIENSVNRLKEDGQAA